MNKLSLRGPALAVVVAGSIASCGPGPSARPPAGSVPAPTTPAVEPGARMFQDSTYEELRPYAPADRVVAVVRCDAVEKLSLGSRRERQQMTTTVLSAAHHAPGSKLMLAAFAQGAPRMVVGQVYVIAAYRESLADPLALVEARASSPDAATRDREAAEAEIERALGGGTPLAQLDFAQVPFKIVDNAPRSGEVPREISFAVDPVVEVGSQGAAGAPEPARPLLIVTGRLRNAGAAARAVRLSPVGTRGVGPATATPFAATLVDSPAFADTRSPESPVPPRVIEVTVPARTEIVFRTSIDTGTLRYTGSPDVEIQWSFFYLDARQRPAGTVRTRLPARP